MRKYLLIFTYGLLISNIFISGADTPNKIDPVRRKKLEELLQNRPTTLPTSEEMKRAAVEKANKKDLSKQKENFLSTIETTKGNVNLLLTGDEFHNQKIWTQLESVDKRIPLRKDTSVIINQLYADIPAFKKLIDDAAVEQLTQDDCIIPHNCTADHTLKRCVNTKAMALFLNNNKYKVPLVYENHWQKTSVKMMNDESILMFSAAIEGPSGQGCRGNEFIATNFIQKFNMGISCSLTSIIRNRWYNIRTELFDKDPYQDQPTYGGNVEGISADDVKGRWLKESQLTNQCATFPDNSFVVTHVWGGIEVHRGQTVENFIINNSIASVSCCSDNKKIVIGSYDGTITIVDISQTSNDPKEMSKKIFDQYFKSKDYADNICPMTVASARLACGTAVRHITHISKDTFIFSDSDLDQQNIFQGTLQGDKIEIYSLHTTAPLTCLTTCQYQDAWYAAYGNKDGDVFVYDTNKNQVVFSLPNQSNGSVTALSFYAPTLSGKNDDMCLVVGTDKGQLSWWIVSPLRGVECLTTIDHTFPISSIQVAPNNEHITVKVTEPKSEYKYEDHIFVYSAPHTMCESKQKDAKKMNKIMKQLKNEPEDLYKILCNNAYFLYLKNIKGAKELGDQMSENILRGLQNMNCSAMSLDELGQFLRAFPGVDIAAPMEVYMSGMHIPEDTDFLADLKKQIKKEHSRILGLFIEANLYNQYSEEDIDTFLKSISNHFTIYRMPAYVRAKIFVQNNKLLTTGFAFAAATLGYFGYQSIFKK